MEDLLPFEPRDHMGHELGFDVVGRSQRQYPLDPLSRPRFSPHSPPTMVAASANPEEAGPSRTRAPDSWRPEKYLEPNHPDNEEVLEQAAYQAAVTRPPGDARANRKYKPRRTVDYMGGVQKWRMVCIACCLLAPMPQAVLPHQTDDNSWARSRV